MRSLARSRKHAGDQHGSIDLQLSDDEPSLIRNRDRFDVRTTNAYALPGDKPAILTDVGAGNGTVQSSRPRGF